MTPENLAATLSAMGRWGGYISVVALTGVAGFYGFVREPWSTRAGAVAPQAERRVLGVALGATALMISALGWRLYAQTYSIFGVDDRVTWEFVRIVVFDTGWGGGWRWQFGATIVSVGLMVGAIMIVNARAWFTAIAALAVIGTLPLTGHAVSRDGSALIPVAIQVAHVGAAGVWIGTLAIIVAVVRPRSSAEYSAAIRAFSPVAVGAVGMLVTSGVITAVIYLENVSDLWAGIYGRTLVAKVLLFGGVAGFGAYNWRRLKPMLDQEGVRDRLRRSASVELAVAVVVLGVTAVLVALPLADH